MESFHKDLVQIARLALLQQVEDVRLYVARMVRKYRDTNPDLAKELSEFLRNNPSRSHSPLRRAVAPTASPAPVPADDESRLSLLRHYEDSPDRLAPILTPALRMALEQLVQERKQAKKLSDQGLEPTRSAIFVGPPGVGKTLTARWLASQLGLPFYILDLTAVMSSLLGRSGSNLRAALDFAKQRPCVLLLDEIDSIAKRRSDDSDVGELKRLVTVILQEVDAWPGTGLLLAATNHPELIDPALWRRFDLTIDFPSPSKTEIRTVLDRYLSHDRGVFEQWVEVLATAFHGRSFSDIEREVQRIRRAVALGTSEPRDLLEDLIRSHAAVLGRDARINFAVMVAKTTRLSQHAVSELTGVSRDTIRKHTSTENPELQS